MLKILQLLALPLILSCINSAYAADDLFNQFESNSLSNLANDSEEEEFLRVEDAYQVYIGLESGQAILRWQIADGYYLYQERFKAIANTGEDKQPLNLEFQAGKLKFDEYYNKELTVYYQGTEMVTAIPATLKALEVTSQGCADAGLCYPPRTQYFTLDSGSAIEIDAESYASLYTINHPTTTATLKSNSTPAESQPMLLIVLLGAFLGGLILNLMPCVFPVLSLKALSFASSHQATHKQHLHGWAYTLGVVGSFVIVATVIIVARQAGDAIGWGFQLQSPLFITFLIYLFLVMGLSLSGVFTFGTRWMGAGQSWTTGTGLSASFCTGVLAAVVASPCTAPFMATALGFALTQTTPVALLIFAALGLGMAAPFLLLSYAPSLARKLPRPGPWMDTLKQFLAFPLYITSIWLLWVLGRQVGTDAVAIAMLGAVMIIFSLWLLRHRPISHLGRGILNITSLASLALAALLAWQAAGFNQAKKTLWEVYSPEKLAELRANNQAIFVNLTADWCITCKVNERLALNTEAVHKTASDLGIVLLKGDWTNADPVITRLLTQFNRTGVPLYLMYPADSQASAKVLPQVLTPGIVLDSMKEATASRKTAAISSH